ncbi:MAG: SIS domain-containing protein [Paracoccaceae bacterium]
MFRDTAKHVIQTEMQALTALAEHLDDGFDNAAQAILNAPGRVIVSGIGKSGHIAHKIAATLASTGTPAFFVHPAEASHGDLGMVAKGDIVLAISNSGEAPELANLLSYTRRFGIPLIGLSSRMDSTLMREADIHLLIPQTGEACGYGVVPSNSTTMTLALGDALAIALMHHRNFTPEHFRDFHPGGKLGAQLSRVRDLMHTDVPMVPSGTAMSEALLIMTQKGFGVVGVEGDHGQLAGIVTDGDLRRHMKDLLTLDVDQVMTRNPRTIAPDSMAEKAVAEMTMKTPKVTCLFVVNPNGDGQAEGILHIHDCLRAGLA